MRLVFSSRLLLFFTTDEVKNDFLPEWLLFLVFSLWLPLLLPWRALATFRLQYEDDYEYEFSVLSTRFRFGGRKFSKCACSEIKTRARSRPRTAIWRSLLDTMTVNAMITRKLQNVWSKSVDDSYCKFVSRFLNHCILLSYLVHCIGVFVLAFSSLSPFQ
mgnify:CR=1 FL=1